MGVDLIISYDGTPNDDDALALGRMLHAAGGSLGLAYVRHVHEFDPRREELAQHDSERLLARGAEWLGDASISQHVIVSASTSEGLAALAAAEGASAIVFGSDYRTPPGRAEPGTTAQLLLEGGPVVIAVAAAGLRLRPDGEIHTIAIEADAGDEAVAQTAQALAEALGASLGGADHDSDLVVAGSQSSGPTGRISLSGRTRALLNGVRGSVLVVPQGKPLLL